MDHLKLNEALRRGDHDAFKQLFDTYYNQLLAYLTTLTRDHAQAEDLTQQAFLKLWNQRESLTPDRSPKQFLFSMGHNLFVDTYRRNKKHMDVIAQLKHEALSNRLDDDTDHLQMHIEKLKSIINKLPPRCQEILRMNKLEGLKYQEIADYLDISKKTVEGQMRLAFQKIREAFDKDDTIVMFFLVDALTALYGKPDKG